ncbi:MAG: AsmA-like C-terminal region-containing protein [Planctomycetaceae bacterium]
MPDPFPGPRPGVRAAWADMKPLADILWSLVRWALPLTVAGVAAAIAIGSTRVGEEVRRRVEARLREEFPGLVVQVEGAGLVEGQGIMVRGVTLADPALPTRHRQVVRIDEILLDCRTTLAELAAGAPRITAVRLRRPTVHAVRAPDGGWSVARLLVRRPVREAVPVSVDDATLVVEDPAHRQWLTVRQIGLEVAPAAAGVTLRGVASSDLFERATFTGTLGLRDGTFDLAGTVESLDVSPRVHALVPAGGAAEWIAGLRGRVGLDWHVAGSLDAPAAVAFGVDGRIEAGRFEHASLPFALSDVSAAFHADRSGATWERLEARSGTTLVRGSGRLAGWRPDADVDLLLEAERLTVGRHWEGFLPGALAAQWSKLMPAGEIDVSARLARRAGALSPDVAVRCRNVSLTHYRFPYRLDRTVGTVTFKGTTLQIHLTGEAGGHPVHVEGTIDTAPAGGRGFVEVSGDGMRIDDALLAALPPRSADILRKLRAAGTFDFVFRHDRSPQSPGGHANSLGIRLEQCSLAYAGFPYPLSNVAGTIRMDRGRWTIGELTGSNDTGIVRCTGTLEPRGDDDGELVLHLAGSGVVLERELRDALPPGMRRIWDDLDPRGSAAFAATVRHRVKARDTAVELEAVPQGDTVSIEPAWFPYRLERLRGRLVWRDGRLRFEDVRGAHDRTTVAAAGSCRFTPDGGWHVSFERLAADRFRLDRQVLDALPEGLARAVAGVRLGGLLSLEGTIDVHSTEPVAVVRPDGRTESLPGPPAAAWDVQLDMEQASLDVGVPVEHVHGGVRLRGASDGRAWSSRGDVAIDSAMIRGVQLTAVEGPLALDAAGVRFGQPAGGPAGPGRRFSARLAGGRLAADGSVESGEAGRFTVAASLADADLARLATEATGVAHRYAGRVQGAVEVSGSRAGTHSLGGRGQVRLTDADIYELPVVVALLKILRVRAPDRNAFTSSVVDFHIEGPRAYLDTIELSGDAISLVGAGEVDFDSNLRLTFRSIMGEAETQLPVMKRVMGGASGPFMLMHVDGTLADPVTSTEAFPTLAAAIQQFQTQRREGAGPRIAGGRAAPR